MVTTRLCSSGWWQAFAQSPQHFATYLSFEAAEHCKSPVGPKFLKTCFEVLKLVSERKYALTAWKNALTAQIYSLTSRKGFKIILLRDFWTIFGFMAHPLTGGFTMILTFEAAELEGNFPSQRKFINFSSNHKIPLSHTLHLWERGHFHGKWKEMILLPLDQGRETYPQKPPTTINPTENSLLSKLFLSTSLRGRFLYTPTPPPLKIPS